MSDNLNQDEILKKFLDSISELTDAMQPLTEEEKKAEEQAKKSKDKVEKLTAEFGNLTKSLGSMAKSMVSADEGVGKYATGVEGATGAFAGMAGQLGILGKVAGGLINIFGALAGGALKQQEALVKTSKALAAAGDLGNADFGQLANDIQKAGFSVTDGGEKYASIIAQNAEGIAGFGGTVTEGRKNLLDLFGKAGALGQFEYTLGRLGYNSEDAFKHAAFWSGQLAVSGAKTKLNDEQLASSTKSYLVNLTALSDLTGQSREAMEARMQQDSNDVRFQMHLEELRATGIKSNIDMADNLARGMAALPPGLAEGIKSSIVNHGAIVDEAAVKANLATGGQLNKLVTAFNTNTDDFPVALGTALHSVSGDIKNQFRVFGSAIKAGGNDLGESVGLNADLYKMANRAMGTDIPTFAANLKKTMDLTEKNGQDQNTTQVKQQRMMRNAYEQLEMTIGQSLVPAITRFQTIMNSLGKVFADMLFKFGGPDLRDLFVDMSNLSEVTETLTKKNKEEVEIKDEIQGRLESGKILDSIIAGEEANKKAQGKDFKGQGALDIHKQQAAANQASIGQLQSRLEQVHQSQKQLGAAQSNVTVSNQGGTAPSIPTTLNTNGRVGMGAITPELQEKLEKLAEAFPGGTITGLNDSDIFPGHALPDPHGAGRAVDFVPANFDPSQKEAYIKALTALGFSKVGVEMKGQKNSNNTVATGDHIHAQLGARTGGIFSGPQSGYQVELHGHEAVLPMSKFNNFYNKMDEKEQKSVTNSPLSSLNTSFNSSTSSDELVRTLSGFMDLMSDKFDDMIAQQRKVLDVNEQLLTYTKH